MPDIITPDRPIVTATSADGPNVALASQRRTSWVVGSPVSAKRVFSYVVTSDSGFAPNPFHGFLTLACCKPVIRRTADVGDIVVGLSSRSERIIYAMQVAEIMGFEEYWEDPRYRARRPKVDSPRAVDRRGDNIYEPLEDRFRQLHSFHSNRDGSEDSDRKREDLGGKRVLVGERFTYWGMSGPPLPEELSFLAVGRGHRSKFSSDQVGRVATWFADLPGGVLGPPAMWRPGDESWREQ